jgi:hypothetical protein
VDDLTALEREWTKRLAASGFQDLEGRDRDGPLSDRGNLHAVTGEDGQQERLAERIEHGSAYHTWATDVLRSHRFASRLQRDAWASHADGDGIRETARQLGVTFHRARCELQAVRAAIALTGRRQRREPECPNPKILRSLVRRSDPSTLASLAILLLRA